MKLKFFSWAALCGLIVTIVMPCIAQNKEVETLYHKVEWHSLAHIEWEDEDWSETTYYEYLKRSLEYQRNPQEFKKRRSAFRLLCSLEEKTDVKLSSAVLADPTTWTDLNLFSGAHDTASCFVDKINKCHTQLGRAMLCCMLANPQTSVEHLHKRQQIIQELVNNPALCDALDAALERSAKTENFMLSFWLQDQIGQAAKRHYFNITGFDSFNNELNKSDTALVLGALWDYNTLITMACTSAVAAVVLPLYALSRVMDKQLPPSMQKFAQGLRRGGPMVFLTAAALEYTQSPKIIRAGENGEIMGDGLLYGMGIKSNFQWVRDNIMLDVLLQEKLIDVATYIGALHDLEALADTSPVLTQSLSRVGDLRHVIHELPKQSEEVAQLFELLKTDTFKGTASLFSHKGRVLAAYRLVPMVKDQIAPALAALAELDVYVGIAKLMKEFQHKRVCYSFVTFQKHATPYIYLKDFWNPFVDADKVIPNTITLDGSTNQANAVLTGPNAGGKSTILKAIALNLILAQTFGVCPAAAATITPFSSIATYLNIADDIANGNSLFKAEVLRAQALVKKVEQLKDGEFSFVAIDEMFSGTSPHEGRAAAYSVAKHLGKFRNNISIIATHFPLLTNLAQDTTYFANYKVTVNVAPDGTITYPFKLEQGISDQHVAIDILKAEGFDDQILADALNLVRSA